MEINKKFIPSTLNDNCVVFINDMFYWMDNANAIYSWMRQYNGAIRQSGLIVDFDSEELRTLFMLRWS